MTRYLVDTNVISAAAPTVASKRAEVVWRMDAHSADLFLSAITIAEIADGIAKGRRTGATRKASDLSAWLQALLHLYVDRVLAFDTPTAEVAGTLSDLARCRGHAPGFADIAVGYRAPSWADVAFAQRAALRADGRGRRRSVPEVAAPQLKPS